MGPKILLIEEDPEMADIIKDLIEDICSLKVVDSLPTIYQAIQTAQFDFCFIHTSFKTTQETKLDFRSVQQDLKSKRPNMILVAYSTLDVSDIKGRFGNEFDDYFSLCGIIRENFERFLKKYGF